jgi:8-oxo-dGTP pyrophosphatase MutT (NUDIX family)
MIKSTPKPNGFGKVCKNEILMIQAYRYVTNSIGWEIPAGLIDPDETIIDAGKREVFEETGYETTDLELFYTYHPMNGISNQTFNIVRGRALTRTGEFGINEVKSVAWHSPDTVRQMIADNVIKDGFTLTALLLHLLQRENILE